MARTLFVGADIRVSADTLDAEWSSARRQTYLLRTSVARPLSIDRAVWAAPPTPDDQRAHDPLPWVAIGEVRQRAVALAQETELPCVVIVIGLLVDSAEDEALARTRGFDTEVDVQPTWTFLGFDVADGGISGLSNCGYPADGVETLRAEWASRLGDHGLFGNAVDAIAFRSASGERVPEHAPFAVYAIWTVETVSSPT